MLYCATVEITQVCTKSTLVYNTSVHWEKYSKINDTFERVIRILVNWHISACILTKMALAILVKIHAEMCQFTRIPSTRLNVSLILLYFSQQWVAVGFHFHCRKPHYDDTHLPLTTSIHTEKSFRNLIKSNWNQVVFTILPIITSAHREMKFFRNLIKSNWNPIVQGHFFKFVNSNAV